MLPRDEVDETKEPPLPPCAACGRPGEFVTWGQRMCVPCFADFSDSQGHLLECGNLDKGRTFAEAQAEARRIVGAWVSGKKGKAA